MKKILTIARHDFLVTVMRPGYIVAVAGLPLFMAAIMGITMLTARWSIRSATRPANAVAVVDEARLIDRALVTELDQKRPVSSATRPRGRVRLVFYDNADAALADVRRHKVAASYVIPADYVASGKVTVFVAEGGLLSSLTSPGRAQVTELLRASLVQGRLGKEASERVLNPLVLEEFHLQKTGQIEPVRGEFGRFERFVGPFGMFILLTLAIFVSSGYLLQATAEEKQNRVIEVLLSSVKPTELLAGKILGLGAAGVLQVAFYVVLLVVTSMTLLALVKFSAGVVLLALVYFVLGYLLFASLMAGTGILGNSVQESSQLSALWTVTSMIPMMLFGFIYDAPNSAVARGLSFFPLTAPVTMLLRVSTAEVPVLDIVLSIASLCLGIYLAIRFAAKLFRAASLMYGKRPALTEIIRWLREA